MVYAAERHAVGFEGAGDEENALGELAEQDNALAAEAAGEEDEDGAGCEGVAVFGGVGGLAGLGVELAHAIGLNLGFELLVRAGHGISDTALNSRAALIFLPSSSAAPPPQHSTWMLFVQP